MTNSAATLLNVVKSYSASDVMSYTADQKAHAKQNSPPGDEANRREQAAVIVIDSTMTPLEAAKVLWSKNIMGAPVYDAKTKTYVGMFDVRDILSCVTAAHREFLAMGGNHRKPGEDTRLPSEVEAHHKTQSELMAKVRRASYLPSSILSYLQHTHKQLSLHRHYRTSKSTLTILPLPLEL
jgi:hypothetical protein